MALIRFDAHAAISFGLASLKLSDCVRLDSEFELSHKSFKLMAFEINAIYRSGQVPSSSINPMLNHVRVMFGLLFQENHRIGRR